jgi:hypothetical protein
MTYTPFILPPCSTVGELQSAMQQMLDLLAVQIGGDSGTSSGGSSGGSGGISLDTGMRLSLDTIAITDTDMASKTRVYGVAVGQAAIPLFNGTDVVAQPFTSPLLLDLDVQHSPLREYPVFAHVGTTGAVRLGTGPVWVSATSSGTGTGTSELEQFQGRAVNKFPVALRNAGQVQTAAPRQAIFVGLLGTTEFVGQTEDSFERRLLCNVYNALPRPQRRLDGTDNWTIPAGSTTFRIANGNAKNCLESVQAVSGRALRAQVQAVMQTDTNANGGIGLCVDAVNTVDPFCLKSVLSIDATRASMMQASLVAMPGVGRHKVNWIEWAGTPPNPSGGTRIVYGDAGNNLVLQSGMIGEMIG